MAWSLASLFGRSEKPVSDLSFLHADLHSHVLPGIDDGARTIEEAVELVEMMGKAGYRKLVATPHIMNDLYPNTPDTILSALESLRDALRKRGIGVAVDAAAEYYLDEHFLKLLDKGELLTFGDRYVLFETSYTIRPYALAEHIYAMAARGYRPVMAHPERYTYLHDAFDEYRRLKEMGTLFQINLNSLGGYYGLPVRKAAEGLVEAGLVDFLGSDVHRKRHVEFFSRSLEHPALLSIAGKNTLLNATLV